MPPGSPRKYCEPEYPGTGLRDELPGPSSVRGNASSRCDPREVALRFALGVSFALMGSLSSLPPDIAGGLCCPRCRGGLHCVREQICCASSSCAATFPLVNGVPVLIDDRRSVFAIEDFVSNRPTTYSTATTGRWKAAVLRWMPKIGVNLRARQNYLRLRELLRTKSARPRILVLGGSVLGEGMGELAIDPSLDLVETDVAFGPRTALICDAHRIPFRDGSFDCVIIQAVLEHVVDPFACVAEVHRVLKDRGVVYAETPFMQQVHGGRYDFMRFTHLGHRRLFRCFDEVDSGLVGGPGMALAWSYQYLMLSFATSRGLRAAIRVWAGMTGFFLKYFDYLVMDKPGALDAASGYFFLGLRSEASMSDRELLQSYRGAGS